MMQHGIHSTFDTHNALCMDHYKCRSGSFNVIHCHHSQSQNCLARCRVTFFVTKYRDLFCDQGGGWGGGVRAGPPPIISIPGAVPLVASGRLRPKTGCTN